MANSDWDIDFNVVESSTITRNSAKSKYGSTYSKVLSTLETLAVGKSIILDLSSPKAKPESFRWGLRQFLNQNGKLDEFQVSLNTQTNMVEIRRRD